MSVAPTEAAQVDLSSLTDVELMQLYTELQKREALAARNGSLFYKPHRKQALFHAAAYLRYRYVRVGNRWGKSEMGAAEDVAFCLGERLWLPKSDPNRYVGIPHHPVKGVLIGTDWDKMAEIFTNNTGDLNARGKIFRYLPADSIENIHRNHSGNIDRIDIRGLHGVSSLFFDTVKSFMANPMGHESSDWDFVHVDEPCPKEMWEAYARGLMDRRGKVWFLCTPIIEAWINDMFMPDVRTTLNPDQPFCYDENHWMLTGSTYDNPNLSAQAIDEFASGLSEEVRKSRVEGLPASLAGLVYKEYDPVRHLEYGVPFGWRDAHTPPINYTIRVAIDPHPSTPHAVLFAATAPTGHTYFYDEIFEKLTITDLANKVKAKLSGRNPFYIICDPYAWIENPTNGETWADIMYRLGLPIEKAIKDLEHGISIAKDVLTNKPVRFMAHLKNFRREIDRYMWDPKKPNKPIDKDDHMMENFYRMCFNGFSYRDPFPAQLHPDTFRTQQFGPLPNYTFGGQTDETPDYLARYR